MTKENKMYNYLLNHNYISGNKKSDYQSELSVERAECIVNKFNSLVEEENTNLKQALNEIREYINKNTDSNPIDNLTYKLFIYKKEEYEFIEDILKIIEKGLREDNG